jgi:hypothetical protein
MNTERRLNYLLPRAPLLTVHSPPKKNYLFYIDKLDAEFVLIYPEVLKIITPSRNSQNSVISLLMKRSRKIYPQFRALFVKVITGIALHIAITPSAPLAALTLDTLETDGTVSSSSSSGSTVSVQVASTSAIGGGRSLSASKTSLGSGITVLEVSEKTIGYTQGAHLGLGTITWDGDSDPNSLNPTGLGGVNLLQDAASAFVVDLQFFDYPFGQPLPLVLKLYDHTVSSGSKSSELSISLNRAWSGPGSFKLVIPFSLFASAGNGQIQGPEGVSFQTVTALGSSGAADLRSIGAITLTFNGLGNSKAPDIVLGALATDGRCSAVPNKGGAVIDDCGVCLNSLEANRGRDRCGTCLAGPTGYIYSANSLLDGCSLCPSEPLYSYPAGSTDRCGVCLAGPPPYQYKGDPNGCPSTQSNCKRIKPPAKILKFEEALLSKATRLKDRFVADSRRFALHSCPGSFLAEDQIVGDAFAAIAKAGRGIFRKGILVCGNSCVTLSYADQVSALRPKFSTLERHATKMAKRVVRCYRELGITSRNVPGGPGTAALVSNVRSGLSRLIIECRRTRVCPKSLIER